MFLTKASINDPRTLTRMAARLIRKETRIDKAQPPKFPGPRSFRSVAISRSFQLGTASASQQQAGPRSAEYSRILERYLARLVAMKQIPDALGVLRHEIDRNPDDPGTVRAVGAISGSEPIGIAAGRDLPDGDVALPGQILVRQAGSVLSPPQARC